MAALYLLGNPDHYTSHKFVVVYGKNFVREALKPFRSEEDLEEEIPEKLVLQKGKGEYVGFSSVHDYIYRPKMFEDKTLYEWVQMSTRCKVANSSQEHDEITDSDDELDLLEKIEQVNTDVLPQLVDNSDYSDNDGDELNINKHSTSIDIDDSDTSSPI